MFVYADNAATTRVDPDAARETVRWLTDGFGNPSSVHSAGCAARAAVERARTQTAAALHCDPDEIVFTSGGTEANNFALQIAARIGKKQGKRHIVTTRIEHPSVSEPLRRLESDGFDVTYLPVDPYGFVTPERIETALRDDTALVSVMAANNEIGTLEPIAAIASVLRPRGILFHTDAVQAAGHIPVDAAEWNVDFLTLSGHKFHAPKGVGALYLRHGIAAEPLLCGGGQERGLRSGTENVPAIAGLGAAFEKATRTLEKDMRYIAALRDRLIRGLRETIPDIRFNTPDHDALPGIVNVSFAGTEAEPLLHLLDLNGICVSSGSACTAHEGKPSHVLLALGLSEREAHGALRFSFCRDNTEEETDYILATLPRLVRQVRADSAR